jgi:hypothetical protein
MSREVHNDSDAMNKPSDAPLEDLEPPVSPELFAEVLRRRAPEVYEAQRKAARPADEVLAELRKMHFGPR